MLIHTPVLIVLSAPYNQPPPGNHLGASGTYRVGYRQRNEYHRVRAVGAFMTSTFSGFGLRYRRPVGRVSTFFVNRRTSDDSTRSLDNDWRFYISLTILRRLSA